MLMHEKTCVIPIISQGFGYRPQYQPSTIISPLAKALRLIMGSQVDTSGDYQNAMRSSLIIAFAQKTHLHTHAELHRGARGLIVGFNLFPYFFVCEKL